LGFVTQYFPGSIKLYREMFNIPPEVSATVSLTVLNVMKIFIALPDEAKKNDLLANLEISDFLMPATLAPSADSSNEVTAELIAGMHFLGLWHGDANYQNRLEVSQLPQTLCNKIGLVLPALGCWVQQAKYPINAILPQQVFDYLLGTTQDHLLMLISKVHETGAFPSNFSLVPVLTPKIDQIFTFFCRVSGKVVNL